MKAEFPLSELEKKLSLTQGIALLSTPDLLPAQLDISSLASISNTKYQAALQDAKTQAVWQCFESIHKELFQDTHAFDNGQLQAGIQQNEIALRYHTFGNLGKALYDHHGRLRPFHAGTLIPLLAATYKDLLAFLPVSYGNHLTAQVFSTYLMQALTNKAFILDFSLVTEPQDIETLANPHSTFESLANVFAKATTQPSQKKALVPETNSPKEWQPVPDGSFTFSPHSTEVYHKTWKDNQAFILAFDGGLIPLEIAQGYFDTHQTLDGFTVERNHIKHYLKEEWRTRTSLDGIPLGDITKPFRVDADYLTGLTKTEMNQLEQCIQRIKTHHPEFQKGYRYITDLLTFKDMLLPLCQNQWEWDLIEKACGRLQYTAPVLEQKVNALLDNVTPSQTPAYYVTVGGSGAGKGTLIALATKECSNNAVVASLDDARTYFDVWEYGIGHGSDYPHLYTAATQVRNMLLDGALAQRKSVIKDCAGVPYAREKTGLDLAKHAGFSTHVLVTTAPIHASMKRSYWRYYKEDDSIRADGRALPPDILVKKHIGVSQEFSRYIHDTDINRLWVFDNCQSRNECFILAKNQTIPLETLEALSKAKAEGTLTETLKTKNLLPLDSEFQHPKGYANVSTNFLVVAKNGNSATVTLIYDEERFLGFMDKALQNPEAKSPEQLQQSHLPHCTPQLLEKTRDYIPEKSTSGQALLPKRKSYAEIAREKPAENAGVLQASR